MGFSIPKVRLNSSAKEGLSRMKGAITSGIGKLAIIEVEFPSKAETLEERVARLELESDANHGV
jgi:hypothetical protein